MDKRLSQLASYLDQQNYSSGKLLAAKLGVSEKTMRNLIDEWNALFEEHGAQVSSKHGSGYRLTVTNGEEYEAYFQKVFQPGETEKIPSTSAERVEYLLNTLLSRDEYLLIDDLAQQLYISRKTVSAELKQVEEVLKQFQLELERRAGRGIRVKGTEFDWRVCIVNLVLTGQWHEPRFQREAAYMQQITDCVFASLDPQKFTASAIAYQSLTVQVGVLVDRLKTGHSVKLDEERCAKARAGSIYVEASAIANRLEKQFACQVPEEERAYIAIQLAGHLSLARAEAENPMTTQNMEIGQDVWDLVSSMLQTVYDAFLMDLRNDLELRMNLAQHIVPLSVRMRYNTMLQNPILGEIKVQYPLAYAIAQCASTVLNQQYGGQLNEDETGYLALTFALAITRQNTQTEKKNILIVCASGKGGAQLLKYSYQQAFGEYVNQIETCDVKSLQQVDLKNIDYVFTTVPLTQKLPRPVQRVEHFLKPNEIRTVKKILLEEQPESLEAYFDQELFFPHIQAENRRQVLDFLTGEVVKRKGMPADFSKLVWQREKAAQTAYGNLVAMPHPIKAMGEDTFVCVGILDKPIQWGERSVQVIFLLSIANKKNKHLQNFYEGMVRMLSDRESIQSLTKHQNYDRLLQLLRKAQQQEGENEV